MSGSSIFVFPLIVMGLFAWHPPSERTDGTDSAKNRELTAGLRLLALNRKPGEARISVPKTGGGVWGTVADISFANGTTVTVAAFMDGSASIYTSAGGAVIGGAAIESVRAAAKAAVATMEDCSASMKARGIQGLPRPGHATLYALSRSGLLSSEELVSDELLAGGHAFSRCYLAVKEVITKLGAVSSSPPETLNKVLKVGSG